MHSRNFSGLNRRPVCLLGLFLLLTSFLNAQRATSQTPQQELAYGGTHELGAWAGYSGFTGPIWGYSRDVHYTTVDARYSYSFARYPHWDLRYAPEVTLLAALHETKTTEVNSDAPNTRYGAGISPVGFQIVHSPTKRVQPYFLTDSGFVYYNDRVLSPQGSQFMFVIDFGGGVNYFVSRRNAIQFGYRYMHTSNANISIHNPGTDNDIFYVGFSHFHTRGSH